jgi:FlaG/FlaF family flagellin (archaellin)
VSPVIATILLVAIAVVLAAVLYVLVAHVAKSPSAGTPIGTVLALGPAAEVQGTAKTAGYCTTGHPCYDLSIATVASGVGLTDLAFAVDTSAGTARVVQMGTAQISVVSLSNSVLAYTTVAQNNPFEVSAWSTFENGASVRTPLSDTMTIWVQFGDTSLDPIGQGFELVVLGSGSYSNSEKVSLP